MEAFKVDRKLLNPKFEGYKLDPIHQEDVVKRYPLHNRPTQTTFSGRSPLSLQEVRSRISHNHLAVSRNGRRAIYVDAEYNVVVIDFDPATLNPSCRVIYVLPVPIQSSSVEPSHHREYPSAALSLNAGTAFVSDGLGTLYILEVGDAGPGVFLGAFELGQSSSSDSAPPFRIHDVFSVSASTNVAILSSRSYDDSRTISNSTGHRNVLFDVWAAQFPVGLKSDNEAVQAMNVLWHRIGDDVPAYTTYDDSRAAYLLIGSSIYRQLHAAPPLTYTPSPEEAAPIPRRDENLDAEEQPLPPKPPPYSWYQTSDCLTVAFPLPADTPKSNIKVHFSQKTLTLHVQSNESDQTPSISRYTLEPLWDSISPSSSFWTLDREGSHAFGLLTLHIDKLNEIKWMHVFASAGSSDSNTVEVTETVDPSELWHIRESLEKYTAALRDGEDSSGLGLGRGVPSLAEGEIDDEIDSNVGRTVNLTWINGNNPDAPWISEEEQAPFTLLSTPLPGVADGNTSLVIKNTIDGPEFSLSPAKIPGDPVIWTHCSTFSALAFVLASKQDTRFTYHLSSEHSSAAAVLAFENGARNRAGNVYIYRGASPNEQWAKQVVLKVESGSGGSLLGVGAMKDESGRILVLCLTEGELITISGVL